LRRLSGALVDLDLRIGKRSSRRSSSEKNLFCQVPSPLANLRLEKNALARGGHVNT
jgi:hypothetical protein